MICSVILDIIAFLAIAYVLLKLLISLKNVIYPYVAPSIDLKKKCGTEWACITGASDGIGREYALQLAEKGFNIILIARTERKLVAVKEEIHLKYPGTEVAIIVYDFTRTKMEDYNAYLLSELRRYDIGIFINNVGMCFEYPEIFHQTKGGLEKINDILLVNVVPVTLLTAYILPQMVARNKGIVINIASFAGYHQMPEWNTYSASKRYVIHLTACLQKEYSNTEIIIQSINPGLVCTKLSKVDTPGIFAPTAEKFVRSAIRTIGRADNTTGYLPHELQAEGSLYIPSFIFDFVVRSHNEKMRKYMKN
uniref:Estradiol 17-beta-dehydrogenase 12 n=1 Tax=Parastrongyloides trichosuri TaxID=131310 RepID=A0A0N4Z8F6_PARTI